MLVRLLLLLLILGLATPAVGQVFDGRIATSADDAEEGETGGVELTSSDIELNFESGSCCNVVGLRWQNVTVAKDADCTTAYIQFVADVGETQSGAVTVDIFGEDADNAAQFSTSSSTNISDRTKTTATVAWTPTDPWTENEDNTDTRTDDLCAIVEEITSRSGWSSGNAMVFITTVTGDTDHRVAWSYDGDNAKGAYLYIDTANAGKLLLLGVGR